MTLAAALIIGALLGWLTSVILREQQGRQIVSLLLIGLLGALLGGLLLAPSIGSGSMMGTGFSLPNLLLSQLGAIVTLAIVALFRRWSRSPRP